MTSMPGVPLLDELLELARMEVEPDHAPPGARELCQQEGLAAPARACVHHQLTRARPASSATTCAPS